MGWVIVYLVTMGVLIVGALGGWLLHICRPPNYVAARKCLVFIPKMLVWPHYLVKGIVLEMRKTLREGRE